MTHGWPRLAPVIALALAAMAIMVVATDMKAPIRPVAALGFAVLGPGLVVMRFVRMPSIAIEVALAVPVSLTIDALLAGAVLYVGDWSAGLVLVLVSGITAALAVLQLLRPPERIDGAREDVAAPE